MGGKRLGGQQKKFWGWQTNYHPLIYINKLKLVSDPIPDDQQDDEG